MSIVHNQELPKFEHQFAGNMLSQVVSPTSDMLVNVNSALLFYNHCSHSLTEPGN